MALLEIRNVTRRYADLVAVDGVSFSVESGEFFTLLGPSGSGKTTLLRMIAGFEDPDAGEIFLDGKSLAGIPPEKRPVHTVFQSYALFPHMTVWDNIAFPLRMAKRPTQDVHRLTQETLEQVRLTEKRNQYPHELSGGQKQRVALGRSLVNRPRLLLLDESLGALDAKLRERMQLELIALQRDVGVTFVFVTHAQDEALALSHRIAVMNEGRIEQLDEPSRLYGFPANRFVADFIGNVNLLEAEVREATPGHLRLEVAGLGDVIAPPLNGASARDRGALSIRPEQVRIGHHHDDAELENHFTGTVQDLLYQGDVTTYKVRLPNGATIAALLANSAPGRAKFYEVGDTVIVAWRRDAGMFLHG